MTGPAGSVWADAKPLVLASRSVSRRLLLADCGIQVELAPADIDERDIEAKMAGAGASPVSIAHALASAKALAASSVMKGRVVLGGDQVLAFEDRCWAKARNLDEAASRLAMLAGHTHHLISAAALACDGALMFECIDTAALDMRALTATEITAYLAITGEDVLSSVGAYRIEGIGRLLFKRINGEQSTIVGLPLGRLLAYFRHVGLTRL